MEGRDPREIQRVDRIHACIHARRRRRGVEGEEGGGLEKVKGEGGGIKMSFSLVRERHVTPCPSNPVKRAIYESSKLDFERHCAPLFYGGFQDFFAPVY